jgi:glutamyl-tRNA synthetase
LNVQPGPKVCFNDIVRDRVEFDRENIDDQVLIKSDGYPTYHLANVVDDHLMKITHVIRGEEWLSSTPKHILLYENFDWEQPVFAHLPLLLNSDKSKLSKRQGDVAVEDYKEKGYLKEALINFVALLGWSAGDNQEIYQIDEKLKWINETHLRNKPDIEIIPEIRHVLQENGLNSDSFKDKYLHKVIEAMKERVSFAYEYVTNCRYLYETPTIYNEDTVNKRWEADSLSLLIKLGEGFESLQNPSKHDYEKVLIRISEESGEGKGKLIHPLRLAISGVGGGPGVYDILDIIGKEETMKRLKAAVAHFS